PAASHHALDILGQHLAQMGPAHIEHSPQVAEWLDYAGWRFGGYRDIDPAVHAFQNGDGGRMQSQIALSGEEGLRGTELGRISLCQVKKPVYAGCYRLLMNIAGRAHGAAS